MEEKKVIDEIKEQCGDCEAWSGTDCTRNPYTQGCLKDELPKPRKKILANRVYSDSMLKKWSKKDLIEQIRILEHNWACTEETLNNSVKNSEKIFSEQKAEIERLTEERNELEQRYLEESKERCKFEQLYEKKCHERNIGASVQRSHWEKKVQQAVKDTAKEILQGLIEKAYVNECIDLTVNEAKAWFREDYGVEVE